MNKQKKIGIVFISMALIVAGCITFSYMQKRTYSVDIPLVTDVKSVFISDEHKNVEVTQKKEIQELMYILKGNGRTTKKESTNDSPMNSEKAIKVEYNVNDEKLVTSYVYIKNNTYYLEQPYNGIYKISEDEYQDIAAILR